MAHNSYIECKYHAYVKFICVERETHKLMDISKVLDYHIKFEYDNNHPDRRMIDESIYKFLNGKDVKYLLNIGLHCSGEDLKQIIEKNAFSYELKITMDNEYYVHQMNQMCMLDHPESIKKYLAEQN